MNDQLESLDTVQSASPLNTRQMCAKVCVEFAPNMILCNLFLDLIVLFIPLDNSTDWRS